MSGDLVIFLIFLLIVAAFVNGDFAIKIVYLFVGAFLVSQLWVQKNRKAIRYERKVDRHAFWGENIPVNIKITNSSVIPVPWLQMYESMPVELVAGIPIKQVVSLNPRGRVELDYILHARKRGYYAIGPLFISLGDMLGLCDIQHGKASTDFLTVFPRIIPFTKVDLPSHSPLGTLRTNQPIFEDPSRVLSKRNYVYGDSMRRIDWKSSASVGNLQVKLYESSIELEVVLFLNMKISDYSAKARIDSQELAVVIAASLANWVISKKQSVGLITNGISVIEDSEFRPIMPHKGRTHLMHILETLAKIKGGDSYSITNALQKYGAKLSWGTTAVIITGKIDDGLFDEVFSARRRGLRIVLIVAGRESNIPSMKKRAEKFNLPFFTFQSEEDLDIWRQ